MTFLPDQGPLLPVDQERSLVAEEPEGPGDQARRKEQERDDDEEPEGEAEPPGEGPPERFLGDLPEERQEGEKERSSQKTDERLEATALPEDHPVRLLEALHPFHS